MYPGVARLRRLPPANPRDPSGVDTRTAHRLDDVLTARWSCYRQGFLRRSESGGRGYLLAGCARFVMNTFRKFPFGELKKAMPRTVIGDCASIL
jgi:hypothetical protein